MRGPDPTPISRAGLKPLIFHLFDMHFDKSDSRSAAGAPFSQIILFCLVLQAFWLKLELALPRNLQPSNLLKTICFKWFLAPPFLKPFVFLCCFRAPLFQDHLRYEGAGPITTTTTTTTTTAAVGALLLEHIADECKLPTITHTF